jgi:3-dehydroshikimate dehydratase
MRTLDSGLKVAAYGSYYRTGVGHPKADPFEKVLETAVELGAPTIRVWAGNKSSKDADAGWWFRVIEDTRNIASLAEQAGVSICFEYHGNTLTDSPQAVLRLMKEVNHPNLCSLWQPPAALGTNECLLLIKDIFPWIGNVHVFHWNDHGRLPLEEGKDRWTKYLEILSQLTDERFVMLEFVRNDQPEQMLRDAEVLNQIVEYVKRGEEV